MAQSSMSDVSKTLAVSENQSTTVGDLLQELNERLDRMVKSSEQLQADIEAFKPEDQISYLPWRELRQLCRERRIPRFSRLNTRSSMITALRSRSKTS